MAASKISAKPAITALNGTELTVFVQSGTTKKGTVADIKTYIGSGLLDNIVGYTVRAGNANGYRLSYRSDIGSFPAAYVTPTNNNTPIAFDIFPKGTAPESVGNGFAWQDICSTDITIDGGNIQTARIAIASDRAYVGSFKFGTATLLPFAISMNGVDQMTFGVDGFIKTPLSVYPVYANNAAAIAGGLVAGQHYRTGGNPDLICIVH